MTKRVLLIVLGLAFVATVAYGQLANTPWPKARADERNTSSTSAAYVAMPIPAWKVAVDAGAESAGVTLDKNGNVVYMDVSGTLKSVNSGGIIWEVPDFGSVTSGPVSASPTHGDRIYAQNAFYGELDALVAVNVIDGSVIWSLPIGATSDTSPTVGSDGIIYMAAGDQFFCVQDDGTSASMIWSTTLPASAFAGPLALNDGIANDDRVYVSSKHSVMCIQQDGATNWSVVWQQDSMLNVRRSPAIGPDPDGDVFVATLNWDIATVPETLFCLDGDTGLMKWSVATIVNGGITAYHDSGPSLDSAGTTLYVVNGSGGTNLLAYDPSDGSLKWSLQVDPRGGSASAPSIVDVGGTTYIYAAHGPSAKVYCVKDEGISGSLQWSYEADAGTWGAVAVGSDGTVYLASVGAGSEVIALLPYDGCPRITTDSLPKALWPLAYWTQLEAWGGDLPYTWTIDSGSLPTGLILSTSGFISGMTTDSGTHNFVVKVTDSTPGTPLTSTKALSIFVEYDGIDIRGRPPEGFILQPYSASLSAIGGWPPYTFSITGGSLPPGISMDTNANFTGTPVTMGTYLFSVTVTDSWPTPPQTATKDFGINIFTPSPVIEDVRRNVSGQIEIQFNARGDTVKIESSTDPYSYDEDLMNWAVEVTGLTSGTWIDTSTPTSGEKYYRVVFDGPSWNWSGKLLAYEPFDYEIDSNIIGQSGGVGWQDVWQLSTGVPEGPTTDAQGLSYGSLPVEGGSARFVNQLPTHNSSYIERNMENEVGIVGTTRWYSALLKANAYGPSWDADWWCSPGGDGSVMFGKWGNHNIMMAHLINPNVFCAIGETYFLVVRVDYLALWDIFVQIWVNPYSLDPTDPPVDGSDAWGYAYLEFTCFHIIEPSQVWNLGIRSNALGDGQWDELRAAESWGAVIGTPSPNAPTVGMKIFSLVTGRNMVSSPFEPFPDGGGTPGSSTLDKIIDTQLTGHPVSQWASDKIEAWDADLQTYVGAWLKAGQGWTDWNSMLDPATFGIDSDAGYWFKLNTSAKDIMFFGQVSQTSREIEMKMNRNMVGSCFPISCPLTESNLIGSLMTGHPVSQWASDKIEFWDAVGQTYVGVWYRTGLGWRAWNDMDNPPAAPYDTIDPGEGWWIKVNNTPFTWDYPRPD